MPALLDPTDRGIVTEELTGRTELTTGPNIPRRSGARGVKEELANGEQASIERRTQKNSHIEPLRAGDAAGRRYN